jgi:arginase family enzyme
MISLPYSDGEHTACEKAPKVINNQFKGIFSNESNSKISLPEYKEAKIDSIPKDKIYIGGDHTISYHILKQHPTEALLVFDAHPDVFQQFDKPTHLDWLKFVVEEGIVKPENIILVGIRNPHPSELVYFKEKGITYFTCKGIKLQDSCDMIMERLRNKSLHISIDMDVLDPAFAPGVSYPEPAGLTTRQLLYYLQRIRRLNPTSIDLVEVNPEKDVNSITSKTAAKIIAEFL